MTDLKDFETKLKQISNEDWKSLFDLIPIIEKTETFGETIGGEKNSEGIFNMPHTKPAAIVNDFFHKVNELGIVPMFDWVSWTEGSDIIKNKDTDYSKLSTEILCKLITVIIRANRFNEGYLVISFEKGIILKILKGLKQNIYG